MTASPPKVVGAPGLLLGDNVRIAQGVRFGAHVIVHDGTVNRDCPITRALTAKWASCGCGRGSASVPAL
jgi:hypothetical protein